MIPVVIGSNPERHGWVTDCLDSIHATTSTRRKIVVHETGGYEPAAIRTGCDRFERFLFLHDSVIVLTKQFWHIIDNSGPAWLAGFPPMFLAVYDSITVLPHLPDEPVTKRDAINLEARLPELITMPTIWGNVTDATALRHEHKHGRDNKVLGNQHFIKFKGTWS